MATTPNRRSGSYEPIIGNRNTTVIQRTAHPGNSPITRQTNRLSYGAAPPAGITLQPGTYANATGKGVNSMKESRAQEKKDMQNLNERFATYIERVRFLEAQNKALQTELDKLRKNFDPTKIKDMYETELAQARNIIDDLSKEKADTDVKLVSLEDQLTHEKAQTADEKARADDYKDKYEDALGKVRQLEAENNTLQDRIQNAEDDCKNARANQQRVQDDNTRLRGDLDNETVAHINMANKCQSLEEELAFITSVYEQEIRDLQALANRDDSGDLREYWKGELSKAIREIQAEYDNRLDQMRNDMDSKYNNQILEIRAGQMNSAPSRDNDLTKEESKRNKSKIMDLTSKLSELQARNAYLESQVKSLNQQMEDKDTMHDAETKHLKDQIQHLQQELESVLQEIQALMDAKLTLELEIAAYRKLLDVEENR
ncbi:60 kDa neurofilament protein-like [Liolophura sinensis]|uniref:60 kDa neurofilament protein-like n=1 Tax=Liolophura sinensis TaxID=3198878 RepID=UPI00315800D0